ncbi:MAG: DUF996 domain-containing protein [Candidatus Bathyarchaeota archaeon]|nr:DUF996 domain-containing protein [Candidatus Termiticorpusculum sp.]
MNFETSKNLGTIGALLMFLGCIPLFVNQTLVFGCIEIIGGLLIIVSLYGFANFYKNKNIFTNALFGGVVAIIGSILMSIIAEVKLLPLSMDLTHQLYPDWNGDPSSLQNLTPDIANLDLSAVMPLLTILLLILAIFCVSAIIATFFIRRSLKDLATHSGTNRFATVSLLLLIGAILSIIAVGLLLIWIATLVLAIAFFTMKQTNSTPPQ